MNLITVPACKRHNEEISNLDERFREFLTFAVGNNSPTSDALWQSVARGLNQPEAKKRKSKLLESLVPTPDGNTAILIDNEVVEGMLERITRGLFWYKYKQVLPQEHKIETYVFENLNGLEHYISRVFRKSVAAGQFQFACSQLEDESTVSLWIYVFHNQFAAGATTNIEYVKNRLAAEGKA